MGGSTVPARSPSTDPSAAIDQLADRDRSSDAQRASENTTEGVAPLGRLDKLPEELQRDILLRVAAEPGPMLKDYAQVCRTAYQQVFDLAVCINASRVADVRASNPLLDSSAKKALRYPVFEEALVSRARRYLDKVNGLSPLDLISREYSIEDAILEGACVDVLRRYPSKTDVKVNLLRHLTQTAGREEVLFSYCRQGLFDTGLSEKQARQLTDYCSKHSKGQELAIQRAEATWTRDQNNVKTIHHLLHTLDSCAKGSPALALKCQELRLEVAAHVAEVAVGSSACANLRTTFRSLLCLPDLISLCVHHGQQQTADSLCTLIEPRHPRHSAMMDGLRQQSPALQEEVASHRPGSTQATELRPIDANVPFTPRYLGDVDPAFFQRPRRQAAPFRRTAEDL